MNLIHISDVTFTRNNVQKKKTENTLDQGNHNEKTLLYVPHYNNVERGNNIVNTVRAESDEAPTARLQRIQLNNFPALVTFDDQ